MERTTDICIVGGSGAGLSAAIRATEQGARVLLLEKMKTTGGCTKMAGGIFGIGSDLQRANGYDYHPDDMFRQVMMVHNWNCDGKLVHKWLNHAERNIRWLEELGVSFSEVVALGGVDENVRRIHHVTADRQTGKHMWQALLGRCEELGVEIITGTRAQKLVRDKSGAVVSVESEGPNGLLTVHAKATILATGSISSNQDLIHRFYQSDQYKDIRIMANVPHNTGDGLLMAEEIGAGIGQISTLYIGPHNHFPGASEGVGCLPRRPQPIKVNRNGERFVDESINATGEFGWMQSVAVDRQPGKVCYAILDEALLQSYLKTREIYGYIENRFNRFDEYPGQWLDKLRDSIKSEIAAGRAFVADTLEELAPYIGCDPAALRATLDQYNRYCEQGYDEDFLKPSHYLIPLRTGPYYAVKGPSGIDTCIGGIKIDHTQRVLDREEYPIPGLYGAGVLTSGYLSYFYGFPGTEMSYTLYSGQEAGIHSANYIKTAGAAH